MSNTHPFTSSFWIGTKPRAPYSSSHMSNTGERPSHIRSISKYVWTITTYYLVLGVQPNQDISNHPNDVKTSGLQPLSTSSTYRRIGYSECVYTRPFRITRVYNKQVLHKHNICLIPILNILLFKYSYPL